MTRHPRIVCAIAAVLAALTFSTALAQSPGDVLLPVPQRSQLDGTVYASSNCGPASLAMLLETFGSRTPNLSLRKRANQITGYAGPDSGTNIQDLARIAREHGLTVKGPGEAKKLSRWSADEVRAELRGGHPVLVQVYFPLLPNQKKNPIVTDHYVVLVGLEGKNFIFNDPADGKQPGYRQRMTEEELLRAWGASKEPFAAFSVAPGSAGFVKPGSVEGVSPTAQPLTPTPAGTATATPTATPSSATGEPEAPPAVNREGTGGSGPAPVTTWSLLDGLLRLLPFGAP